MLYDDRLQDLLREELFVRVNVAGDGSCLFWATTLAYLIPVRCSDSLFQQRCEKLFGNVQFARHIHLLIKSYNPSSVCTYLIHDETVKKLVTEQFRNRVIDELSSNPNKFRDSITINDFLHCRNEGYVKRGRFLDRFLSEFGSEIARHKIDVAKFKPYFLSEAAVDIIDNELQKIPDQNKVKQFKFMTYLECMRDSKAWGGNHELQAMSHMLGCNIHVFFDSTRHSIRYENSNDWIQLFNNGEVHYEFGLIKAPILIEAMKKNEQHKVKVYLKFGISDVDYKDGKGCTVLHYAAQHGDVEAIQLLIFQGADNNIKNHLNQTPLDVATLFKKIIPSRILSD